MLQFVYVHPLQTLIFILLSAVQNFKSCILLC